MNKKPVKKAAAKTRTTRPAKNPAMRIRDVHISQDAAVPHGYKRHELRLPPLPKGVRPQGMAMDDSSPFPNGGYLNTNSVYGMTAFGLYFPGYPYLAELAQRSEYRQPAETTANEMTRKWISFKSRGKGDKSDKIREIEDAFEEFKVRALFRRATILDGFYGLGQIFIDIAGHDDHALPLVIEPETIEKGALRGFTTVEPMWVTPLTYNAIDPTMPNFYKPDAWMVLGRETHQTRLINFVSYEIPDIIKPAYNFGGLSLSQLIEPYVTRWLKTVDSVNRLVNNFSIIFLQTDMAAILQGEADTDLLKRLKMFIRDRDNQGIFVTDKDREMLEQLAVPLSGLSELQAQAQEHMAAPTHLPLVVLTGITPAGLNASSEGEIDVFHDWIHSKQEQLYGDPLHKVLDLVQLHLYGTIDPDITFTFNPMRELQGRAAAEVYQMKANAGIAYIDAGVIDPREERERLSIDPESGYTNLDADDLPEPPMEHEPEPGSNGDEPDE